jgi:hypothetical protein
MMKVENFDRRVVADALRFGLPLIISDSATRSSKLINRKGCGYY